MLKLAIGAIKEAKKIYEKVYELEKVTTLKEER